MPHSISTEEARILRCALVVIRGMAGSQPLSEVLRLIRDVADQALTNESAENLKVRQRATRRRVNSEAKESI